MASGSDLKRELLKKRLPYGLTNSKDRVDGSGLLKRRRDYTPVSWKNYFDSFQDIAVDDLGTFRIYKSGSSGPVLLLLHGGGFSALTWSLFAAKVTSLSHCQVLALDIRGHGDTETLDDMNLSTETLTNDIYHLVGTLFCKDPPPIILVGHSMGGAIAIHTAAQRLLPTLIGLVVVDVVEGTALEALSAMQNFLKSRPKTFSSLEEAIEWRLGKCVRNYFEDDFEYSVRSGQLRNLESAKVSMQGQLVKCESSASVENEPCDRTQYSGTTQNELPIISETETSDSDGLSENQDQAHDLNVTEQCKYRWKIDLSKTEQFWNGWFNDMSRLFLSSPVPNLLLVAGRERLDKELTVAHIQGKFQLQILTKCGHSVHEDDPDKVAEILVAFMSRHKFAEPKQSFPRHVPCC